MLLGDYFDATEFTVDIRCLMPIYLSVLQDYFNSFHDFDGRANFDAELFY